MAVVPKPRKPQNTGCLVAFGVVLVALLYSFVSVVGTGSSG